MEAWGITVQVYCLSSQVKANMYWLGSSIKILKNALYKSVTVKKLLGLDVSSECGLGTAGCQGMTVFIACKSWTNLLAQPLGFLTAKIGVFQTLVQGIMKP